MTKVVNVTDVPYTLQAVTGVSKVILLIGTRNEVVVVNGSGVGPDLAELGPYFWNVVPLANLKVRAAVLHLVNERGLAKIVTI